MFPLTSYVRARQKDMYNLLHAYFTFHPNACVRKVTSSTRCLSQKLYSVLENDIDVENMFEGKKVSKAMRAYLQRAKQYEEFMKKEIVEYKIGKRHLANMMGEDPETFTEEDVDKAIRYLLPSAVFEPRARPLMRPPHEVFPPRKAAEFDASGRPYSFLFYTGKPNLYNVLYDAVEHLCALNDFEDKMIQKHISPDPNLALDLVGSDWLPKDMLEKQLVERVHEKEYQSLIATLERLAQHPYAQRAKDFIQQYRHTLLSQMPKQEIPEPLMDAQGRAYVTTTNCLRKRAWAEVTVRANGSGKVSINGQGMQYFSDLQAREQVLFPLIFTDLVGQFDVEARVEGGGESGQAGAVRWGIAMGLRSFVDTDTVEKMRIAGLLTRDYRKPERKKPGQEGARRKYTWKKR